MKLEVVRKSFLDELSKIGADLTAAEREKIPSKKFALTGKQSTTGKKAYPLDTEGRARAAIGFVGMHGSPEQKSEVYRDVARLYPHLAAKSSVPGLRAHAKEKAAMGMGNEHATPPNPTSMNATPMPKTFTPPPVQGSLQGLSGGQGGIGKAGSVLSALKGPVGEHATELAGLGVLAVPGLDTLQARARARLAKDVTPHAVERRQFLGEGGHAAADVGGLGILMGPEIGKLMAGRH